MATKSKFAKNQQKGKRQYKNRGTVLWVSCQIVEMPKTDMSGNVILDGKGNPVLVPFKRSVQGTRRMNWTGPKGKENKKAARKLTHTKGYYRKQRLTLAK